MSAQIPEIPDKEYFTTGETASHCGVTPNAVFKWVQEGRILADRTPGGHYRISRESLMDFLKSRHIKKPGIGPKKLFQYCWEFHARFGKIQENCRKCVVYRSRAARCYELIEYAQEIGHFKLFCVNSCDDCDYYDMVHAEKISLLIISSREEIRSIIQSRSREFGWSIRFTDNEYHCSRIIESYRPDYIIFDCDNKLPCKIEFVKNLGADLRIPMSRLIIIGNPEKCGRECTELVSGFMQSPFDVEKMLKLINGL